jgi:hypothetical protein
MTPEQQSVWDDYIADLRDFWEGREIDDPQEYAILAADDELRDLRPRLAALLAVARAAVTLRRGDAAFDRLADAPMPEGTPEARGAASDGMAEARGNWEAEIKGLRGAVDALPAGLAAALGATGQ